MRFYKNDVTLVGRLADLAHEETVSQYNMRMKTEHPGDVIFYDMFNNKFAELIIQNCIQIIHKQDKIPEEFFYAKSAHIHELAIKQHFGIDNE